MYIKPKQENPKPKREKPQPSPQNPQFVRIKQMAPNGQEQLSRDYVREQKKLVILSWDYVIETGKEFGNDLWWDPTYGWYIYDDEAEENFTGLSYEVYEDGSLRYYEYCKDGLEEGIGVEFYPSGELKSYCIVHKRKTTEIFYEWYENGRIKLYFDGKRWLYVDEEGYILRRAGRK